MRRRTCSSLERVGGTVHVGSGYGGFRYGESVLRENEHEIAANDLSARHR